MSPARKWPGVKQVNVHYCVIAIGTEEQVLPINLSLVQRITLEYCNLVQEKFWEMFLSHMQVQGRGRDGHFQEIVVGGNYTTDQWELSI